MSENGSEWVQWVLGGFVGVLTWLGKVVHTKANNAVSRAEFTEALRQWQEERRTMHAENKETLARIHDRVDELYRSNHWR